MGSQPQTESPTTQKEKENIPWQPVLDVFPMYSKLYAQIDTIDKFGMQLLSNVLKFQAKDAFVAMRPIPVSPASISSPVISNNNNNNSIFPLTMAWPFTIVPELTSGNNNSNNISQGVLLTLTDMFTSLHLMLALLPTLVGHVSISMQCNMIKDMKVGEDIIAITKIDKMGKRVLFASVEFIRAQCEEIKENKYNKDKSLINVNAILSQGVVCANAKHVKALLPPNVETTRTTEEKKEQK